MFSSGKKTILLVNPWIQDFSAYDLWMKPLGLLYIAALLRSKGFKIHLLDCLSFASLPEKFSKDLTPPKRREFGRGHLYKEIIPKPKVLKNIPRRFRRYGVPPPILKNHVENLPRPDLILVTSSMTYWYPGVRETISFLRQNIRHVPIFVGGTYVTLCPEHAQTYSGADRILPGPWDEEKMKIIGETLDCQDDWTEDAFPAWPYPAFDLYRHLDYVCLLTRCGCPFHCTYCASSRLTKGFEARSPEKVIQEIDYWRKRFGVEDFAFYDDALLMNPSMHIKPILREVIRRKMTCRFHTPNAIHIKFIDEEMADLMFRSNFKTIRLGLETANEIVQRETGGKVENPEFTRAVRYLRKAGYPSGEIGVYLLAGLPGQKAEEIAASIDFVQDTGAKPVLVEYSPIPGTVLFDKAKKNSAFDLEQEPLFHNNSLFPCRGDGFTLEDFRKLKEKLKES